MISAEGASCDLTLPRPKALGRAASIARTNAGAGASGLRRTAAAESGDRRRAVGRVAKGLSSISSFQLDNARSTRAGAVSIGEPTSRLRANELWQARPRGPAARRRDQDGATASRQGKESAAIVARRAT